ncbi:hypothetical protein QMG83_08950 [Salinibacterium sp. G-O1]|uniref:hypothetical protein n=1 Tax=Salinibacterium sp. G-O1 TaxID=3046208 RepID=UPI0024B952DE|nr:hypothetical protein [Salinibacterium sp. G-O1]MDJ0335349.1 hypothetical protein [Salinibacterium sp. G-O1]
MTIHNAWGTKPDPVTGLPPYPLRTASTQTRLRKRAADAAALRKQLQARLDSLTEEFESAFSESDKLAATRQRITAAAKTHRKN